MCYHFQQKSGDSQALKPLAQFPGLLRELFGIGLFQTYAFQQEADGINVGVFHHGLIFRMVPLLNRAVHRLWPVLVPAVFRASGAAPCQGGLAADMKTLNAAG